MPIFNVLIASKSFIFLVFLKVGGFFLILRGSHAENVGICLCPIMKEHKTLKCFLIIANMMLSIISIQIEDCSYK